MDRDALRVAFEGRRVLVTGHTGFKGAWLLLVLDALGADVTGIALPPDTDPSLFLQIEGDRLCRSFYADLREAAPIAELVASVRPEVVLHLAAQPLVRRSYVEPVETFATNVMGTVHLLDAVRRVDAPCRVVVVTTDKVYEERPGASFIEGDRLGGKDPYAASKAAVELLCASWRQSYFGATGQDGKRIATARAGNVIGGGDWGPERLFPDVARAVAAERTVILRNPHAVRPWQHVLEPIVGYLTLAARLDVAPESASDAFNFGPLPADALAVEELVRRALRVWGRGSWRSEPDSTAPHEAAFLQIDSTRATERLGWRPRLDVDTAIAWTVEGYDSRPEHVRATLTAQIDQYLAIEEST